MSHLPPKPDFDCSPARYPVDSRQVVRSAPMAPPPERTYRERDVYHPVPRSPTPRERDVYIASRPRPGDSYVASGSHPPPRDVYIAPSYDRRDDDRYRDSYRDRDYDRRDHPPPPEYRYRGRESSRERDWARDRDRDRDRERDRERDIMMERDRHRRWEQDSRRGYDRDRRERSPNRERGWSRREDDRWVGRERTRPEPERTWVPRPSKSPPRQIGEFDFYMRLHVRSLLAKNAGSRQPTTPGSRARSPASPRKLRSPPSHQRSRPRTPPHPPSRGSPAKEATPSVFRLGNHSIELSPRPDRDNRRPEDDRVSRGRYPSRSPSPRRRSPMRLPPRRSPSPLRFETRGRYERHEVQDHLDSREHSSRPSEWREEAMQDSHEQREGQLQQGPERPLELQVETREEKLEPPKPQSTHTSRHPSPLPPVDAVPRKPQTRSSSPMQGVIEQPTIPTVEDAHPNVSKPAESSVHTPAQSSFESHIPSKAGVPSKPIPSMPSSMRRRRVSRSPPTQPRNYVKTPTTPQSPQVQSPLQQGLPTRPEWTNKSSGLSATSPPATEPPPSAPVQQTPVHVPIIPKFEPKPSPISELESEVWKLLLLMIVIIETILVDCPTSRTPHTFDHGARIHCPNNTASDP